MKKGIFHQEDALQFSFVKLLSEGWASFSKTALQFS